MEGLKGRRGVQGGQAMGAGGLECARTHAHTLARRQVARAPASRGRGAHARGTRTGGLGGDEEKGCSRLEGGAAGRAPSRASDTLRAAHACRQRRPLSCRAPGLLCTPPCARASASSGTRGCRGMDGWGWMGGQVRWQPGCTQPQASGCWRGGSARTCSTAPACTQSTCAARLMPACSRCMPAAHLRLHGNGVLLCE